MIIVVHKHVQRYISLGVNFQIKNSSKAHYIGIHFYTHFRNIFQSGKCNLFFV
jgi:hypothetical protein